MHSDSLLATRASDEHSRGGSPSMCANRALASSAALAASRGRRKTLGEDSMAAMDRISFEHLHATQHPCTPEHHCCCQVLLHGRATPSLEIAQICSCKGRQHQLALQACGADQFARLHDAYGLKTTAPNAWAAELFHAEQIIDVTLLSQPAAAAAAAVDC